MLDNQLLKNIIQIKYKYLYLVCLVCVCAHHYWTKVERRTELELENHKYNVDTIIFIDQWRFGVGICLRGYQAEFICAKTSGYYELLPPQEAQTWVKEVIIWLHELSITNVSLELDCTQIVVGVICDILNS